MIVGDFNMEVGETSMNAFCERYSLSSLIKEPTCYKNPANPSCIDLNLTNSPRSFQNSNVIETGLSYFHRMIVTVLKTTFQRLPPKIRNYRGYSNFDHGMFRTCLCNNLSKEDVGNLEKFIKVSINTLNNHAPSKKKYTRGNHLPFMNKELSKALMNRTRLRNVYLRKRSDENRKKYSKQRNYCVSLLRRTKRNYYSSLDAKSVTDNKTFWRTVKPFLSDKTPFNAKITLIEDGEVISSDNEIANVLNTFFSNIVSNLNLPEYPISNPYYNKIRDPVLKAILKCKDHPSIKAIERVPKSKDLFNFSNVEKREILQEIVCLDASKACQDTDLPTKIIKENADIFTDFIHPSINASINNGDFPSFLKLANVIPLFKKDCKNSKDNYRPISILKNISKVYERILFKQIGTYG